MRILFDSKQEIFKTPFGVLAPGEKCTLHVHIPAAVQTRAAQIVLCGQDGQEMGVSPMQYEQTLGICGRSAVSRRTSTPRSGPRAR